MVQCNLKVPKELSFRSAVFSRESAAGSKQIPRRRASYGMTRGGVLFTQRAPLLDFKVLHGFFLPEPFCEIRVNPWRKKFPGAEEPSTGSLGSYRDATLFLVHAKAQQGSNTSDTVELRLVLHINQFHVATDGRRDNGVGDVFQ